MSRQHIVKKDKCSLLFAGSFPDEFAAAFSNRACGNMSLNYADTKGSLDNRRNFLESLGIDQDSLVCTKQIHGVEVKRVNSLQKGSGALIYETALPDVDALITDEKNVPLAIFTADCLPIFLFDPQTRSIGLVHAGWRGTHGRIAQKTIEAMKKEFHARPENVCVQFGPAIRSCCYQVSKDFQDKFPGDIDQQGESFFLDLSGANRKQLNLSGVRPVNIFDCAICTSCHNAEYFSFRKEKNSSGRMMSVMALS
jgi:YfiH family protein